MSNIIKMTRTACCLMVVVTLGVCCGCGMTLFVILN